MNVKAFHTMYTNRNHAQCIYKAETTFKLILQQLIQCYFFSVLFLGFNSKSYKIISDTITCLNAIESSSQFLLSGALSC